MAIRPDDAHSRHAALATLGLDTTANTGDIKRAYRRLAREHHPDVGGDRELFDRLSRAYAALLDQPAPEPPAVARGRPSRASTPSMAPDPAAVDWTRQAVEPGARLSRDGLAVRLAQDPLTPLVATSRAPGSRANRLAPHLSGDLAARLVAQAGVDDRDRAVLTVTMKALARRARRALDGAALDGVWLRHRGPASTTLATQVPRADDPQAAAARAAGRIDTLLATVGWPLSSWTVIDEAR